MMKSILTLFGLLLVAFTTKAFNQNDPLPPPPPPAIFKAPDASSLVNFTSEEKTFKAVFPGKPYHKDEEFDAGKVCYTVTWQNAAYTTVAITDYKSSARLDKEIFLVNYKTKVLSRVKTSIDEETVVSINGTAWTQLKVNTHYGYEIIRIALIDNRAIELKCTVANWHIISEKTKAEFFDEASRFFTSFTLL